jgi:hypothetical protein
MSIEKLKSIVVLSASLTMSACLNEEAKTTEEARPTATEAAPALPSLGADGWIHYTNTLVNEIELINPSTTTKAGVRDADGHCANISEGEAEDDEGTFFFEEDVAFNPTTCEKQTVRGSISTATVEKLNNMSGSEEAASDQVHDRANAPDAVQTAAATLPWHAYVKTAWIDPLNITITSLADDIQWNRYLAMSSEVNNYKFRFDGWSVTPATPPIIWHTGPGWKATSTNDRFYNVDFERIICALFGPVCAALCDFNFNPAIFTHNIMAKGYTNGSRGWSFSDTAHGGCVNLVHHRAWSGFGYMH